MGEIGVSFKIGADASQVTTASLQAGRALDSMARGSRAAHTSFAALDQIGQSATGTINGMAQGVRGLWMAFSIGGKVNIILTAITLAVTALAFAWDRMRDKNEEAAKAQEKNAKAAADLQKWVRSLYKTQSDSNIERTIADTNALTKSYQDQARAIEQAATARQKMAAERGEQAVAGLGAQEAREIAATIGLPDADDQQRLIRENYARQRQQLKYENAALQIEMQREADAQRQASLEEEKKAMPRREYALRGQVESAASEVRAAEKKEARAKGAVRPEDEASIEAYKEAAMATKDARDAHTAALVAMEAGKKAIEDRNKEIGKEIELIGAANAARDETVKTMQAQHALESANLSLSEKQAQAAADQAAIEKSRSQEIEALRRESEGIEQASTKQQEADKSRMSEAKKDVSFWTGLTQQFEQESIHPELRRQRETAEKEQAQEEKRLERRLAEAQRRSQRGARGRGLDDALAAIEARKAKRAAEDEAARAEKDMAKNIQDSTTHLKDIKDKLESLLQVKGS